MDTKTGKTGNEIRLNTARQHQNGPHPTGPAHFCQKCRQHGRNLAAQNEPKSLKNPSKNRSNFELLLGSSLDPKIVPKTTPKVIKNRSKIDLKSDHSTKTRILVLTHKNQWFLHIFHSPGGPKSIKNRSKISSKIDQKKDPQKDRFWERFLVDFGAKLGPKIDPKSIQNGIEKAMQKRRAHGRAKNRKGSRFRPAGPLVQTQGRGWGEVNPSPEGLRAEF